MLRDGKKARTSLLAHVDALYASTGSRQDVEDIELAALDTAYTISFLKFGLQAHVSPEQAGMNLSLMVCSVSMIGLPRASGIAGCANGFSWRPLATIRPLEEGCP